MSTLSQAEVSTPRAERVFRLQAVAAGDDVDVASVRLDADTADPVELGESSPRRDHLAGEVGVAHVGRGEVLRHHGFDHRCEHADGDVARTRFSVRAGRGGRRSPGRRSTWRPPAGGGDGSCRRSSWRSSATTRSVPTARVLGAACWRPAKSRRGRPRTGLGQVPPAGPSTPRLDGRDQLGKAGVGKLCPGWIARRRGAFRRRSDAGRLPGRCRWRPPTARTLP